MNYRLPICIRAAFISVASAVFLSSCATAPQTVITPQLAGNYVLDPQHTSVIWSLSHSGLSQYTARFDRASGTLVFDADVPAQSRLDVTIEAGSVSTGLPDFDETLREDSRYFDVEQYPEIRFISDAVIVTGENTGLVTGNLTFRGVTQPMTLEVTFNGAGKSFGHPGDTLGFSAKGRLKRSDFGMTHLTAFGIGDEVDINIQTEFNVKALGRVRLGVLSPSEEYKMGKTQLLKAGAEAFGLARERLARGDVIALPTETVYGLAVRADGIDGLQKIYDLKSRDAGKPLPLCVTGERMAALYAEISPRGYAIMRAFWPGPLTLVLPRLDAFGLPAQCYGPDGTIALRCPDTGWAKAFRKSHTAFPIALTSANLSGEAAAHTAQDVRKNFDGKIPLIIDDGVCEGVPSTIIRLKYEHIEVLREGPISLAQIEGAAPLRQTA